MKKFYLVLNIVLAVGGLTAVHAQDTSICNAAFQATPDGKTVYFRAMDSLPGVRHTWNFGDGSPLVTDGFTEVHIYAAFGNYLVTHVVVDSAHHCRDSASQLVNVGQPAPTCGVYITETSDSVHHQYTFFANPYFTPGVADTVSWTINGTPAGLGDTLHGNFEGGPFAVCAMLSTGDGCHSQSCLTVNPQDSVPSLPPPPQDTCTIAFTAVPKDHKPDQYVFTIVNHQDYDSISWIIVGLDSAFKGTYHGPSFTYTFTDTGYYNVDVTAEKKAGCFVAASKYVHIDSLSAPGALISSYPNPATTQATLNVTLNSSATITVQVYNSMGVLVSTRSVSGYPGVNNITIPVTNLPEGIYYVEVQYGGTTLRSKIQKLQN